MTIPNNSPVVSARGLTKVFNENKAVDAISFDIRPGEIVGFLGPNGAGKTTTIRLLLNILRPNEGELKIFGETFDHHRGFILRQMNASSGTLSLPGKLSILENLRVFADLYGLHRPEPRIYALLEKFDLVALQDRALYSLSTGQQVRTSLAKAFLNQPKLLLLDEPTASLDPEVADRVRTFLINIVKEEGTTVFLTSHNMAEVEKICTRVLFINHGKIETEGTPQELAQRVKRWTVLLRTAKPVSATDQEVFQDCEIETEGLTTAIHTDKNRIGPLLTELIKQGVEIQTISIKEPTLEDFFVHTTRNKKSEYV